MDRILTAALALIDESGLDALSMRRLGKELGVDPMAVYHHIPNKDELLRAVVRQVFSRLAVGLADGSESWQERVRDWARAYRAVALAHPNLVLRILSDTATVAAAAATANESPYAALEASGLPAHDVVRGADVIVDYVHGVVLAEAGATTNSPDALAAFAAALDELPREDVAVQRRLLAGAGARDSFGFGLDVILAGLSARLPA